MMYSKEIRSARGRRSVGGMVNLLFGLLHEGSWFLSLNQLMMEGMIRLVNIFQILRMTCQFSQSLEYCVYRPRVSLFLPYLTTQSTRDGTAESTESRDAIYSVWEHSVNLWICLIGSNGKQDLLHIYFVLLLSLWQSTVWGTCEIHHPPL